MKTFKNFKDKMKEDAPVNSAGGGNIAGIGVGPDGEPGIKKKKKKDIVMGLIKRNVKENTGDSPQEFWNVSLTMEQV